MSNYDFIFSGTSSAATQFIPTVRAVTRVALIAASLFTTSVANASLPAPFSNLQHQSVFAITPSIGTVIGSSSFDAKQDIQQKLDELLQKYQVLAAPIRDARTFSAALPSYIGAPHIWTDGLSEVAFEWVSKTRRVFVTFEGDGEYGYTLKVGDRFVPGESPGSLARQLPKDLVAYLWETG